MGDNCGLSSAPDRNEYTTAASLLFRNSMHIDVVDRILHHIKEIFDDAETLKKKYGIVFMTDRTSAPEPCPLPGQQDGAPALDQSETDTMERSSSTISQGGTIGFKRKRDVVISWAKAGIQRARWAVKDKRRLRKAA
jgi:hypothetical protein